MNTVYISIWLFILLMHLIFSTSGKNASTFDGKKYLKECFEIGGSIFFILTLVKTIALLLKIVFER